MAEKGAIALTAALKDMMSDHLNASLFPACLGVVVSVGGGDVKLRLDILKAELSFKAKQFMVADNLVLREGDRVAVLVLGMGANVDFVVACRLSRNPTVARLGSGLAMKAVARNGDKVVVRVKGTTGVAGDPPHSHSIDFVAEGHIVASGRVVVG